MKVKKPAGQRRQNVFGVVAIDGPPCSPPGWAPDSVHDVARLLTAVYEDVTPGCRRTPPRSAIGADDHLHGRCMQKKLWCILDGKERCYSFCWVQCNRKHPQLLHTPIELQLLLVVVQLQPHVTCYEFFPQSAPMALLGGVRLQPGVTSS